MCNPKGLLFPFRICKHQHTRPCADSNGQCTPKCCCGSACAVCCFPCYLTCWIPFCLAYYGCCCFICHSDDMDRKAGIADD